MKHILISTALLFILNLAFAQDKSPWGSANITFKATSKNGDNVKADQILLNLEFKNIADTSIRILDLFDQPQTNFMLYIKDKQKQIVPPFGGLLTDFPPGNVFKYVKIAKGQSYNHDFDVSAALNKRNITLSPGTYTVNMIYINNYGKYCVKGEYDSPPVTISVVQ